MKERVAKTTHRAYSDIVNSSIVPYFQAHPIELTQIKPVHLERYYTTLYQRELSPNTILHHHANIHKALRDAVKKELILTNPAAIVDKPKKKKFIPEPYAKEEMLMLLKCVQGDSLEIAINLAVFYGLRRSEITGLRWKDIDFDKRLITVRHPYHYNGSSQDAYIIAQNALKQNASFRTLPLIQEVGVLLQQQLFNKQLDSEYVLCRSRGEAMRPAYITARFPTIIKKYGLRRVRFHDLRHSYASLLLANGVPMKQIQEWLGHSDFSTTANIYAHLDFNSKLSSAEALVNGLHLETGENSGDGASFIRLGWERTSAFPLPSWA